MSSQNQQSNKILLEQTQRILNDIKNDIFTIKNDIKCINDKLNKLPNEDNDFHKIETQTEISTQRGWFW